MIIAAFDLATATGVCDGLVGGTPRLWTWHLDDQGKDRGQRFLVLHDFLRRYFAQWPCDAVVYEAPLPLGMIGEQRPGKKRIIMSEDAITFARGSIGVLELCCAYHQKPVQPFPVQPARASVLGWRTNRGGGALVPVRARDGKATVREETTKERVLREVRALGIKPENDNEADAYVLWQYACNRQNPRLAIAQTPLFREGLDGPNERYVRGSTVRAATAAKARSYYRATGTGHRRREGRRPC